MNQRGGGSGGNESAKDGAAVQELAAAVVHGLYRTVKACQFHTDVSNDVVTSLTAAAATSVNEYCSRAGTETVALSFLGDAIFVNRQIFKASRDTHALAAELRALLGTCDVTELTLARTVTRGAISAFAKLLADVQRDHSLIPRLTSGSLPGITAGKAKFAATGASADESPGQRAARTYATAVLTVQATLAEVQGGTFTLPRKIKRVAQQVVARADEDARLLVALAATGGVSLDVSTIAVGTSILAVGMARQLTSDRTVLVNAAMTALLYDAGRTAINASAGGSTRILNDDELDRVPARTVVALTALGRMHAPARARTALLYEVWSMRRAHRLGPVYNGRRPASLLARIIGVARAFAELRGAGADGGLSIDDALQVLQTRATEGTERALVKLLIGALGIYPAGTMVTLNTGELGVVLSTPAMPLDYVRPPVKILYDKNASLLDTPIDVDLAAAVPGEAPRFIAKAIDADEQQMKAMRAYVVAASASKRRGAIDSPPTPPPTRAAVETAEPEPIATLRPAPAAEVRLITGQLPVTVRPAPDARVLLSEVPATVRPTPESRNTPLIESNELLGGARITMRETGVAITPVPETKPKRRRDPRNDSAPPSSMTEEIHIPTAVVQPAAPKRAEPSTTFDSDTRTTDPVPEGELLVEAGPIETPRVELPVPEEALRDIEGLLQALDEQPAPVVVSTPPTKDDPAVVSKRDNLLAAFLADGPIEGQTEPPPSKNTDKP